MDCEGCDFERLKPKERCGACPNGENIRQEVTSDIRALIHAIHSMEYTGKYEPVDIKEYIRKYPKGLETARTYGEEKRQRDKIILNLRKNYNCVEIAAQMGISADTVRKICKNALGGAKDGKVHE
jgi:hypothetical protein